MRNIFFVVIFLLSLVSCTPEGRVFEKHQKLSPDVEWLKKDKREFKIDIEDTNSAYNISLTFRYANGYQFQIAKVKVTEITPSGKETSQEYALKIRADNGEYIGKPGYDIWDSEHLVEENKKFQEKGVYSYVIEHVMPTDPLNFAMEIGMIVDKVN